MSATGCTRVCFIILNFIFWLIGLFLVGFISWTMATNPDVVGGFTTGSKYFTYSILSAGVLVTLAGLFGCIGGIMEGSCLLKTYCAFVILVLLIEIGGAVAAVVVKEKLSHYRSSGWEDFNTDTKDFLQEKLKCCGFNNYTEYSDTPANLTVLPDSCFSDSDSKIQENLFNATCWDKIRDWLDGNMATWIGTVAGVGVIEILCLIFAIVMICQIKDAGKVKSHDNWDNRYNGRPGGRGR